MSILLFGIGNTLRRDDGAGAELVEYFADRNDCRVMIVHQLLPEHCDQLNQHEQVVFVDAAVNIDRVMWERLHPTIGAPSLGHIGDPSWLLSLCLTFHGRTPSAWLLTIPAHDLSYGEGLSTGTAEAVERGIQQLEDQITK